MVVSWVLVCSLVQNEAYLVLVGTEAEVLDGLTGVLWSTEEDDVAASWGTESELVEGEALTTGLLNAGTGGGGEAQSAHGHLRHLIETVVVSDGGDDGADLALVSLAGVLVGGDRDELAERNRGLSN